MWDELDTLVECDQQQVILRKQILRVDDGWNYFKGNYSGGLSYKRCRTFRVFAIGESLLYMTVITSKWHTFSYIQTKLEMSPL
jgi:hypothetical protein